MFRNYKLKKKGRTYLGTLVNADLEYVYFIVITKTKLNSLIWKQVIPLRQWTLYFKVSIIVWHEIIQQQFVDKKEQTYIAIFEENWTRAIESINNTRINWLH